MRNMILSGAVALVAGTLTAGALAGEGTMGEHKNHDKSLADKPATTQPVNVQVQGESSLAEDNAVKAGGQMKSGDASMSTTDADMDKRSGGQMQAGDRGSRQNTTGSGQIGADTSSDDAAMKARAEVKTDTDKSVKSHDHSMKKDGGMKASAEVDTDDAQKASAEMKDTESKPEGSDKPHLQNENPEKPHLSDK